MHLGTSRLTTLTGSARRLPGVIASARRAATPHLRQGVLGSRWNSSSTGSQGQSKSNSNAPLAFVLGSVLSGAAAYYFAKSSGDALVDGAAHTELSSKYGSPDDFKKAIEELKQLFPDEDTVTTDPDHLAEHGMSDNDYHICEYAPALWTHGECRFLAELETGAGIDVDA